MESSNRLRDIASANALAASAEETLQPSRTVVRMASRGMAGGLGEDDTGPPSLWLYIGGLCVTLSGLYAVNYGQEAPAFATFTYALAVTGYTISFMLRRTQLAYESLRLPMLVLVGLGLFAWLSSGQTEALGDVRSGLVDRSHAMQLLCVWIALLQPFASGSDAVVLFSCVPCMSLIALVSTTNPDTEVQNAFLVFIGAATFLMVHENYLRTRRAAGLNAAASDDRKLFGGQLQLAIGCVLCAFILANLVAIPMHAFGRSLQLASGWGQAGNLLPKPTPPVPGVLTNDSQTMLIGTGPVTESETPVMRVESSRGGSWRGATLDRYTGQEFQNSLIDRRRLYPANEAADLRAMQQFHTSDSGPDASQLLKFDVGANLVEPLPSVVDDAHTVEQTVTLLAPGILQCYGIGRQLAVSVPSDKSLEYTASGGLFVTSPFAIDAKYRVTSIAPPDDEATLRSARSSPADIPTQIAEKYLQLATPVAPENARLRAIAEQVTASGATTYEKATAIHDYIAQTCKYNLQTAAAPPDSDRVEYFLTSSHMGYCDSFAAAMTMLARYAGIPARVAAGYVMGEADGKGGYIVRLKDKHAWSELYFAGVGWIPFDPTDAAQDISDHSQHKNSKGVSFIGWLFSHGWLPPLLLGAVILLMGYLVWTELLPRLKPARSRADDGTHSSNRMVVAAYVQACGALHKRGMHRPRSATPSEFLAMVRPTIAQLSPETADALASLTALHDRFRYGREAATGAEAQQAAGLAAAIQTALARVSAKALSRMAPAAGGT